MDEGQRDAGSPHAAATKWREAQAQERIQLELQEMLVKEDAAAAQGGLSDADTPPPPTWPLLRQQQQQQRVHQLQQQEPRQPTTGPRVVGPVGGAGSRLRRPARTGHRDPGGDPLVNLGETPP